MTSQDIIRTCISNENIKTIVYSLPVHFHELMSSECLFRLAKMHMNAALTSFEREQEPERLYSFKEAKGLVVSIDRQVVLAVTSSVTPKLQTAIDALPSSSHPDPGSQTTLHGASRDPPTSLDNLAPEPMQTSANEAIRRASENGHVSETRENSGSDESGLLSIANDQCDYEACLDATPGELIEIVDVVLTHENGPTVTQQRQCFYFSEQDHPMHTITVPVRHWPTMDALVSWIAGEMNRVGTCSYEAVWLQKERRVKISGSAPFDMLFEQTPNGIHRVIGLTRSNHKGKAAYISDEIIKQPVSLKACIHGVPWSTGLDGNRDPKHKVKSFRCPDDRTVRVCLLDDHGASFDYGAHTITLRRPMPSGLTNPFSSLAARK